MKRTSQSIHSNELLEALTESILEIDSQYQKVQQLKRLLIAQNKPAVSQIPNSYAAKYLVTHKKNTMSMKNLPEPSSPLLKSASKECLIEKKIEKDELFIHTKEQEIRFKAEKAKLDEKLLRELESKVKSLESDLAVIEKQKIYDSKQFNSQISQEFCRNIIHETILKAVLLSASKKSAQILSQKSFLKDLYNNQEALISEIRQLRSDFFQEWQDYEKLRKKLEEKDQSINLTLSKLLSDSKSLNDSKQNLTLKQREEQLKSKETAALNKLKALNQQKELLDNKSQKLTNPPKTSSKSPNPSIRESKLSAKELQLQETEASLALEEVEVEEKRKKLMGKWEKMISKVDDANKQEHKISFNQQELDEKCKEFLAYKKECEHKLSTQETLLLNQESNFLRKLGKLEEGIDDLQRDSLEESLEDTFSKQFIERQQLRKKEMEDLSNKKKQITLTISSFLSELN